MRTKAKKKIKIGQDISLDIGTNNIRAYKNNALILDIPNMIAIKKDNNSIVAIGNDAKKMYGKTPDNIIVISPFENGVISNYIASVSIFKYCIKKISRKSLIAPRILTNTISSSNETSKKALKQALIDSGVRDVIIYDNSYLSMIGSGLDIFSKKGKMLINIGAGSSSLDVISIGKIIFSKSINIGGNYFDNQIIDFIRLKYNLVITKKEAEKIKIEIRSFSPFINQKKMTIKGLNYVSSKMEIVEINSDQILDVFIDGAYLIFNLINEAFENIPIELATDIAKDKIYIAGGLSYINGLDQFINNKVGVKTKIIDDAIYANCRGLDIICNNFKKYN